MSKLRIVHLLFNYYFNITTARERLVFIHYKINIVEIIKPPWVWVVYW